MPLLAEYAITPDVFDVTSYPNEDVCGLHLERIREVMLTEGLVRDLRKGEWGRLFAAGGRAWHRRGKELVKKLATQRRLIAFPPAATELPADDCGWCAEALATHRVCEFSGGVIVTERIKSAHPQEPIVARIDELSTTPWWTRRSSSVRLRRTVDEYREHLEPILHCANSALFIDPHLNPARHGYATFAQLLGMASGRAPAPGIEVHRVRWEDARDKRLQPEFIARIEADFRRALEPTTRSGGLRIEVYLWDDFHDRYLISNLIGISLPNGFDTTGDLSAMTTWTRLGRNERDDVQREFDPASQRHSLTYRFQIH